MEPRKKDVLDIIVPVIIMLIAIWVSLQMAVSYDIAEKQRIIKELQDVDGSIITTEKFNISLFFTDFTERMTQHPFEIKYTQSTLKFLIIAFFICLVGAAYIYTSRKKYINNKEYGTSEWGTAKQISHLLAAHIKAVEIKKIVETKEKYGPNSNILFTQTEKICMYNFELNNNTMIIGGSGSGKTRGYVLPNILQCTNSKFSPSIVVTDPKGEILTKIGHYLEKQKYTIKVLNLKEQNRSFCFNPFCYILPERYEEQISNLVSSIMDSRNENKEQKTNDPFWDDMAKVLLKSIFYAVYEGYPSYQRNMSTVMSMFRWFEVSDNDDRNKNPTKLDRFFEVFGDKNGVLGTVESIISYLSVMLSTGKDQIPIANILGLSVDKKNMMEKMALPIGRDENVELLKYKDAIQSSLQEEWITPELREAAEKAIDGINNYIEARKTNYETIQKPIGVELYEAYGDSNSNPALRNWEDFRTKCKGKTAQSVTATALAKLAPFDEEQIRRIFSKDEMELDMVGERRTALFIVLPPTNKTYNFIANVLYTLLFEQLEYCATVKHNQSLPVPVRFICDEFYNTGRIPNFENILSYARSFGIGISIILQSLDQIKEMYEKSWGTVLDNCSTFLYLGGIRHADTLEYISKLLGKGTFDKRTYSRTRGRQSSSSTSWDKIGRELLDPSEIQRLNKKKCLLFVSGYQPYMSQKFNYMKHPNYKYTSDSNKKFLYSYKMPDETALKENIMFPHREEIQDSSKEKVPHREEMNIEKTPHIQGDYNAEETVEKLSNNVLFWTINSGEEASLADDEFSELDVINSLLADDEEQSQEIKNKINKYKTEHLQVKDDIVAVSQVLVSMPDVSFGSDDNLEEDTTDQEIIEQFNNEIPHGEEFDDYVEDDETDLAEIKADMNDMIAEIQEVLNDFDITSLEGGVMHDEEIA